MAPLVFLQNDVNKEQMWQKFHACVSCVIAQI